MNRNQGKITKNDKNSEKINKFKTEDEKKPSRTVTRWEISTIIFEMISQPIFLLGMHMICNERQCSFTTFPDLSHYASFSTFFNAEALIYYVGFNVVVVILHAIPFGGEKRTINNTTIYVHGFESCLVIIFLFLLLEVMGLPLSYYIDNHIFHLIVSTMIFQMAFGVFLYLYSFFGRDDELNPREINTTFLTSFYNGRQINPWLFKKLNLKLIMVEIVADNLIIVDVALVLRGLNLTDNSGFILNNLNWNSILSHPSLVVIVVIHILYCIVNLYYEHRLCTAYYVIGEGMGYNMAMANCSRWNTLMAQIIYIKEHHIHYPNWQLLCLLSVFFFAFYVYNVTNGQKDHLRRYPNSPESKRMKKIPTSTGKDILCDGWWGRLRQPNISADIVIHLTMLRFGITTPPALTILSLIHYLFERARESQRDCKMKYGQAWQRYCEKVKYVLIPLVY